jgi:predicted ester cyclase
MPGSPMDAVDKFYQAYNEQDPGLWEGAMAEDYVGNVNGQTIPNREVGKGFVELLLKAFPNIHYTIEDSIVGGDRVVTRWKATATHKGDFFGIPPTNRNVTMVGITIFNTRAGKVAALWDVWDQAGLMQQLNS